MPKRLKQEDATETALRVMRQATGDPSFPKPLAEPTADDISAVMRVLGRRGGLKGGKARADALSAKRRRAIAKKGAEARWKNRPAR